MKIAMHLTTKLILLMIAALIITGCSYVSSLEVVNESEHTVELIYTFKEGYVGETPLIQSLYDWEKSQSFWSRFDEPEPFKEMNATDFTIDGKTVKITLPPKQVVQIDQWHWDTKLANSDIERLEVVWNRNRLTFENGIPNAGFEDIGSFRYFLRIRGEIRH